MTKKRVLHVGAGQYNPNNLHKSYRNDGWEEVRFDLEAELEPDIVGDMCDMHMIDDESFDAIWTSHTLEHVYPHQVTTTLNEFFRVLKKGAHALVTMPNIQKVAAEVAKGNLEEPLYESVSGPICAIDIMYGWRHALSKGTYSMAHKTGFTPKTLTNHLEKAGFINIQTQEEGWNLWAVAHKAV